ncbi:MAG: TolC family outer membrane protein [Pseudomonadota bacterium]|nr:TolC family outer membrane protein [Pseudomonadota bacterium]
MVDRNRRQYSALLIPGAVLAGVLAAGPVSAETLSDAFAAAYAANPTLQAERANLRATDEEVPQAISGWRPRVTVTGDLGVNLSERRNGAGVRTADTTIPSTAALTVTQPLYQGGQVTANLESAEALVRAGRQNLRSTEQDVLLDVVTTFMDVLQNQAVVKLNFNNEERLRRQLEAARDRFDVGEITRTDVAQAEARLSRAAADRAQSEGNLIAAKATYARIVGAVPGDLEPPPPLPALPQSEEEALAEAFRANPDLLSIIEVAASSKADIRATSGQLLPQVDLEGSAVHALDSNAPGDRNSQLELRGVVTVPLYETGVVYSGVRQLRQVHNQRRMQVEETRRIVAEGVTQAWEALVTARSRIQAGREEVRANEIALEGVIQEAQVGARTTLDVLDAEQELLDSQVALVQSERDEYVAAFQLLNAVGRLDVVSLGLNVPVYNAGANYNRVRDLWYGTDGGLD